MLSYFLVAPASFLLGVASHVFYYHHGEHQMYGVRYLQFYTLLYIISTFLLTTYTSVPFLSSLSTVTFYITLYFTGLYTSLITYRLFLNPLNKFPGPYFARLTKFQNVIQNRHFDGCHQLKALHEKHGKFVRIGPNDLSVTHPDGVQIVSAPDSKCTKAQWYSNDAPLTSMHTTRDRATHDRRRRIWAPAFSDRALRGYETRIKKYNDIMIDLLQKNEGKPLNMSEVFNHYSFDAMGDLAFGHSFDMLESGEEHWAIKLLNEGMDPLGLQFPPWFFRVVTAIPGAAKGYWQFIGFCCDQLDQRMKQQKAKEEGKEEKDITHVLIKEYEQLEEGVKKDGIALRFLQGDSRLIIVAGSDTTAATLVYTWYHIASDQNVQQKLREEAQRLCPDGKVDHQRIQDAEYLNGCINEALRLHPPVPSGVFRNTPKEGVEIGGTFVPGGTCIQMPQYPMGYDEDNYVDASSFRPERWMAEHADMIKNKDAFGPFSSGPFGCIGKNLAYMEIRLLTVELLLKFDVKLADGEDGDRLLWKTVDHFTLGLGKCDMVWTERK